MSPSPLRPYLALAALGFFTLLVALIINRPEPTHAFPEAGWRDAPEILNNAAITQ